MIIHQRHRVVNRQQQQQEEEQHGIAHKIVFYLYTVVLPILKLIQATGQNKSLCSLVNVPPWSG